MPIIDRFRALAGCLALCAAALAACDGGSPTQPPPPPPPNPLTVTATGRLERGSAVTVTVTNAGAPVTPTYTFQPADGAQVEADGSVRLLRAGSLTVTASAAGLTGSTTLTVAAPPVVVFDRVMGGNRDIWRVDLDGQNLTQLTTDVGDDQDPTVVKGTVVFVSYRAGNGELYSIPLAGGATTRLTSTTRDESTPSLSTDGSKLAFGGVVSGVTRIFTAAADASGPAQLVPGTGPSVIETAPSWSPSAGVAFVSTASGTADIFQVPAGGSAALLTGSPQADVEPAWSRDGQTLAFVSNRSGPVEIYLLKSGTVTQLTSGTGTRSNPAWTPDGRLVFVETIGGVSHLRWIDPAAPGTTTLIETGTSAVSNPAVNLP